MSSCSSAVPRGVLVERLIGKSRVLGDLRQGALDLDLVGGAQVAFLHREAVTARSMPRWDRIWVG